MDERIGSDEPPDDVVGQSRVVFAEALRRGDADAVASVYTNHARLLAPSAELIEGRDAVASFWRAGIDAGLCDVDLAEVEVEGVDGIAFEFGRYTLRLHPMDAEAVVDRGAYVIVHRRQDDGAWRRALEMFTPDQLPARSRSRLPESGMRPDGRVAAIPEGKGP